MKPNWQNIVTVKDINSPISINKLKKARMKLKKMRWHMPIAKHNALRHLNALIAGKQEAYFRQHQFNKKFSWMRLKHAR